MLPQQIWVGFSTNDLSICLSNVNILIHTVASAKLLILLLMLTSSIISLIVILLNHRHSQIFKRSLAEQLNLQNIINQLNSQNEWLVTEMHHRVKNNLQILTSLINSQISFLKDSNAKEALLQSKHRLFTLSLIHQKLFDNPVTPIIDISCCIKEQVAYLTEEFKSEDFVKSTLSIKPLGVDSSFATSFGLIVNELISCTLKIVNAKREPLNIKLILDTLDEKNYKFIYRAQGGELADYRDAFTEKSLGRTLVIGLSRQIRGVVSIMADTYFEFTMDFQIPSELNANNNIEKNP